ncbi:hypothetical protein CIW49_02265 [Mycolicibacterium sp. P1-18]|uniref:hypothetical protein n=1 Tax=Mycolicibacterium sp. P1-18 TaxID=2024615 RepID=UPI0011F1857D|nr:hypothetical protein [Mycolicibacterium sp. P1-18]KAA0102172.1 hypothetical protein CIW49_02265 [Mycolicibacterium sp. P1-18]
MRARRGRDELSPLPWDGRVVDARLQVLDRQLHNHRGDPIGVVDDLDLADVPVGVPIDAGTPAPRAAALVTGHVLATRILGGSTPTSRLVFIPWDLVDRLGVVITLRRNDLRPGSLWVEKWLRRHVVARIPGGRHAPE